jgi:CxxC-x17-CxxC domain-containing protein
MNGSMNNNANSGAPASQAGRRHRYNRNRANRPPSASFNIVCSECNKESVVKFKPKEGKAVFCDSCFRSKKNQPSTTEPIAKKKDEYESINQKLDQFMTFIASQTGS